MKDAATMLGEEDRGTGALGRMAAQDRVLLRGQLLFPFGIGLLNLRNGREIFSSRCQWFHIFDSSFAGFLGVRLPGEIKEAHRNGGKDNQESKGGTFHKEYFQETAARVSCSISALGKMKL